MTEMKMNKKGMPAMMLITVLVYLSLAGCIVAPGHFVQWQPVDTATALKSSQKMNTFRFETFGPKSEQRFGYLMIEDGIQVDMGGAVFVNPGKLTLQEVMDNYARTLKTRMYTGTFLDVREYARGGKVIAYTLAELQVAVSLWDVSVDETKTVIRLNYDDKRSFSGGGDGLGGGDDGRH